jgi:hypothetical protein
MQFQFSTTMERDAQFEVSVTANVYDGRAATRESPEEPAEVEIVSVKDENGEEVHFTDSEQIELEEAAWYHLEERARDDAKHFAPDDF